MGLFLCPYFWSVFHGEADVVLAIDGRELHHAVSEGGIVFGNGVLAFFQNRKVMLNGLPVCILVVDFRGMCDVSGWRDIVAVAAGWFHTMGLRSDGTVVAAGRNNNGQCDVSGWRNIKLPANVEAGQNATAPRDQMFKQ